MTIKVYRYADEMSLRYPTQIIASVVKYSNDFVFNSIYCAQLPGQCK